MREHNGIMQDKYFHNNNNIFVRAMSWILLNTFCFLFFGSLFMELLNSNKLYIQEYLQTLQLPTNVCSNQARMHLKKENFNFVEKKKIISNLKTKFLAFFGSLMIVFKGLIVLLTINFYEDVIALAIAKRLLQVVYFTNCVFIDLDLKISWELLMEFFFGPRIIIHSKESFKYDFVSIENTMHFESIFFSSYFSFEKNNSICNRKVLRHLFIRNIQLKHLSFFWVLIQHQKISINPSQFKDHLTRYHHENENDLVYFPSKYTIKCILIEFYRLSYPYCICFSR